MLTGIDLSKILVGEGVAITDQIISVSQLLGSGSHARAAQSLRLCIC